jgi:hypothetical protein
MSADIEKQQPKDGNVNVKVRTGSGSGSGGVYGFGLIGAWAYYFRRAQTTEERVKAFFKGLAWPAFMVYDLFKFLEKQAPKPEPEPAES